MKARKYIWSFLLLSLVVALVYAYCAVRWRQIQTGFDRVALGDSKQAVLAAMGSPFHRGNCGQLLGFAYKANDCAQEFVYRDPFILVTDGYVIEFDRSDHVIYKDYFSSQEKLP